MQKWGPITWNLFHTMAEKIKDDNKKLLHSDIYRRLFLLSRSFQKWYIYSEKQKRSHFIERISDRIVIKSSFRRWKCMSKQWKKERFMLDTSYMKHVKAVKKKYFINWNNLIHEKHSLDRAINLKEQLDQRYAVHLWLYNIRLQQRKRYLGLKKRAFVLGKFVRYWRVILVLN